MVEPVRRRQFPLIGDGGGLWSFVHIEDAAAGTAAAVERGRAGICQIVDDEPAPVREWLPALTEALGAKPPRHVPRWLGRLLAGEAATVMMTEIRGASNAKASASSVDAALSQLAGRLRQGPGMSASLERLFEELRPAAFAIAYRMLGSVSEAEDVVQEAFLRLHRMLREGERVESPRAYLATVVTRLCIDQLRSARARRERYVGEWLPEPLLASDEAEPARHAGGGLAVAGLPGAAGEPLPRAARRPAARGVRLPLRPDRPDRRQERGQHPPAGNPGLAGRCRSVGRASKRRGAARGAGARCSRRLSTAKLEALEELLADDVVLTATAAASPRRSPTRCTAAPRSRTLLAWFRAGARIGGVSLQAAEVNGQPGALLLDPEGRLVTVLSVDVADGQVQAIRSIVNPDKLRHLGPHRQPRRTPGRRLTVANEQEPCQRW